MNKTLNKKKKKEKSDSEDEQEEKKVVKKLVSGFDRGVTFLTIKEQLIKEHKNMMANINDKVKNDKPIKVLTNKIIYLTIAQIQLANGSRISEAIDAIKEFIENGTKEKVIVKLAKSHTVKVINGKTVETKTRYRNIAYPNWWPLNTSLIKDSDSLNNDTLRMSSFHYLHKNFKCNTHSLRYAFINHMIYHEKKEPALIAKFVGHSNLNQIIRYTQHVESEKLFDDIIKG